MTLFSVVIPVYNAANTIRRCVESIVKSGGEDVQIILVEDGSKDESRAVCQALAEQYPTVSAYYNEQNRGVSFTRNRGLQNATGRYVLFADSDDWIDETYVPTFRRAVESGAAFAICGYVNHDEKHAGRTDTVGWEDFEGERTVVLQDTLKSLYDACLLQQLWNKLFLNEAIQKYAIRFDESISIGEDTRFILDYLEKVQPRTVLLINRPLYHYMRDQDGSLMFRVGYESVEEPLKNLRKLYGLMGMSAQQVEERVNADRQRLVESYAYLIMHNAGMPLKEKKRLIFALDAQSGKALYRRNRWLYIKEKLRKFLG